MGRVNWVPLASELLPSLWQIRRAFRSIRNTLPEITYVFLLFMFSLLMFSLMALKLFGERCECCFFSELAAGGRTRVILRGRRDSGSSKELPVNTSTADACSSCCGTRDLCADLQLVLFLLGTCRQQKACRISETTWRPCLTSTCW